MAQVPSNTVTSTLLLLIWYLIIKFLLYKKHRGILFYAFKYSKFENTSNAFVNTLICDRICKKGSYTRI